MTGSLEVQVLYPAWWRRRVSEAQGRRREAGSEGSVEQSRDPRDTNRIARPTQPDERARGREVHGHQGRGGKSGGGAAKAGGLTSGDLRRVRNSRTERAARPVTAAEKSAEGVVAGATRRRPERWTRQVGRRSRTSHAAENPAGAGLRAGGEG